MRRHSTSMLTARARRSTMSEVHVAEPVAASAADRKSTRLNSSHLVISYAVFCLKKKKKTIHVVIFELAVLANSIMYSGVWVDPPINSTLKDLRLLYVTYVSSK